MPCDLCVQKIDRLFSDDPLGEQKQANDIHTPGGAVGGGGRGGDSKRCQRTTQPTCGPSDVGPEAWPAARGHSRACTHAALSFGHTSQLDAHTDVSQ